MRSSTILSLAKLIRRLWLLFDHTSDDLAMSGRGEERRLFVVEPSLAASDHSELSMKLLLVVAQE